jgi:hypothetical protein
MTEIDGYPDRDHDLTAPKNVTEFLSASQNNDPLLYPGERPDDSYLTDGSLVYALEPDLDNIEELSFTVQMDGETKDLDTFLMEKNAPLLEDRIPLLAFGANMSPGSLASKFAKVGREDALVIPTAYAKLHGHDVVWSGGPGVNGNPIAILYDGPEAADTDVQVGVNFLTPEQVLVMHATELSYELASVEVEIGGRQIRAFYYAGKDSVYLKDGSPVAIESVPADNRLLGTSNASGVLEEVLETPEIMDEVIHEYPELEGADTAMYIQFAAEMKQKGESLPLKRKIQGSMVNKGFSRGVSPNDIQKRLESWANPSTLPTVGDQQKGIFHKDVFRLPSQELGEWVDKDARNKMLRTLTTHLVRNSDGKLVEL